MCVCVRYAVDFEKDGFGDMMMTNRVLVADS